MDTDMKNSHDNTIPIESGMFEIQNEADAEAGDPEIIDHLTTLVIRNSVDDLCIHNNSAKCYQVRHKFTHLSALVNNRKPLLLVKGNSLELEFHDQCVFINFLMQSVTDNVE